MKQRKNVICINSDNSFLNEKKDELHKKKLDNFFYPFSSFKNAVNFLEEQEFANNNKFHYLILDEDILHPRPEKSFKKLSGLTKFIKKMEVIVLSSNTTVGLKNKVMQQPFVNAYLIKPIPENYIEFLITGS
jgi:hypothetical protein